MVFMILCHPHASRTAGLLQNMHFFADRPP